MKYAKGDIWQIAHDADGWVVVPTNTTLRRDGNAVMGAGMAKEAARRFPELPKELADHIRLLNDILFVHRPVICMPTKHNWRDPSRLEWIERGCTELSSFARLLSSVGHGNTIFLPTLGCGLGGLDWERQVRPVVDSLLEGDRFVLVQYDD